MAIDPVFVLSTFINFQKLECRGVIYTLAFLAMLYLYLNKHISNDARDTDAADFVVSI